MPETRMRERYFGNRTTGSTVVPGTSTRVTGTGKKTVTTTLQRIGLPSKWICGLARIKRMEEANTSDSSTTFFSSAYGLVGTDGYICRAYNKKIGLGNKHHPVVCATRIVTIFY